MPVFAEIGPLDLLDDNLPVWARHRGFCAICAELSPHSGRELRATGLAHGDLAATACAKAGRRIMAPAPNRAEAAALARHDPAPAPGR